MPFLNTFIFKNASKPGFYFAIFLLKNWFFSFLNPVIWSKLHKLDTHTKTKSFHGSTKHNQRKSFLDASDNKLFLRTFLLFFPVKVGLICKSSKKCTRTQGWTRKNYERHRNLILYGGQTIMSKSRIVLNEIKNDKIIPWNWKERICRTWTSCLLLLS